MTTTKYKLYNVYQKQEGKFICDCIAPGVEVSEGIFWFDTYLEEPLSLIFDADDFYWKKNLIRTKLFNLCFHMLISEVHKTLMSVLLTC